MRKKIKKNVCSLKTIIIFVSEINNSYAALLRFYSVVFKTERFVYNGKTLITLGVVEVFFFASTFKGDVLKHDTPPSQKQGNDDTYSFRCHFCFKCGEGFSQDLLPATASPIFEELNGSKYGNN